MRTCEERSLKSCWVRLWAEQTQKRPIALKERESDSIHYTMQKLWGASETMDGYQWHKVQRRDK